jgi:hypothetical protein
MTRGDADVARRVSVAIRHGDRPCIGEACDLDAPCERHRRTVDVVARYMRLRALLGAS